MITITIDHVVGYALCPLYRENIFPTVAITKPVIHIQLEYKVFSWLGLFCKVNNNLGFRRGQQLAI